MERGLRTPARSIVGASSQYLLKETIGKGSFGKVKLAFSTSLNDYVAIKVTRRPLPPALLTATSVRLTEAHVRGQPARGHVQMLPVATTPLPALNKEVQILRNLKHPNIIRLLDCFSDSELHYVVLEHSAGGDLFDKIGAARRWAGRPHGRADVAHWQRRPPRMRPPPSARPRRALGPRALLLHPAHQRRGPCTR